MDGGPVFFLRVKVRRTSVSAVTSVFGPADFASLGFKMFFAASVIPSSRDFFARGVFGFGGAAASAGIAIISVDLPRAEIFLLAGADSSFVFITEILVSGRRCVAGSGI